MNRRDKANNEAAAGAREGSGGVPPGEDPLTYDSTQGVGTTAWQQSVRMNAELNARRRRGAH